MTRFVVGDDRSQSTLFPERLPFSGVRFFLQERHGVSCGVFQR